MSNGLATKCCEKQNSSPNLCHPAYMTEYNDNYVWSLYNKYRDVEDNLKDCEEWAESMEKERYPTAIYDGKTSVLDKKECCDGYRKKYETPTNKCTGAVESMSRNKEYRSDTNESIHRALTLKYQPDGGYEDPFKNLITTDSGRRLYYDIMHPDIVHPSMPSSELADVANIYSFKAPLRQKPEIPWTTDLHWRAESQESSWPTKLWKSWANTASSPPYDGWDDQCQYSNYKTPLRDDVAMMDVRRYQKESYFNCGE